MTNFLPKLVICYYFLLKKLNFHFWFSPIFGLCRQSRRQDVLVINASLQTWGLKSDASLFSLEVSQILKTNCSVKTKAQWKTLWKHYGVSFLQKMALLRSNFQSLLCLFQLLKARFVLETMWFSSCVEPLRVPPRWEQLLRDWTETTWLHSRTAGCSSGNGGRPHPLTVTLWWLGIFQVFSILQLFDGFSSWCGWVFSDSLL